jgi:hypothetical protein
LRLGNRAWRRCRSTRLGCCRYPNRIKGAWSCRRPEG